MFALGILFSLASTGLSMFAAHSQGKAAMQQASYSNEIAQQKARNTENEFHERTLRQRRADRETRANITASQAKSGIVTSSGSALRIIGEAAGRQELAIADAARTANASAAADRHRGAIALYEGRQAKSAARMSMLGIGLQGASQAFSTIRTGQYQGAI